MKIKRRDFSTKYSFSKYPLFYLIMSIICCFLVIYSKILFGHQYYVFNDIGSDTNHVNIPFFYQIINLIKNPSWYSFKLAMGGNVLQNLYLFDIFSWLSIILGQENLRDSLVYVMLVKHILAGIFFYRYAFLLKFNSKISFLLALLYSFSGYMVVWGQHYQFGSAIVYSAFLLWMFERWYFQRKVVGLILAISIISFFSMYFAIKMYIFIVLYSIIKYIYLCEKFRLKYFFYYMFKLFVIFSISILISSISWLPFFMNVVRVSPRSGVNSFNLGDIINFVPHFSQLFSSGILRLFSADIIGCGNKFVQANGFNYYEEPILYSGILSLILLPFLYYKSKCREKILVTFVIILSFLFLYNSFFNSALVLFYKNVDYRSCYLFNIVALVGLGKALTKFEEHPLRSVKLSSIFLVFILTFAALIRYYSVRTRIEYVVLILGYLFIFVYFLYFEILARNKYRNIILILLVISELIVFGKISIDNRQLSVDDEYKDGTSEAIDYINSTDTTKFFRIHKLYKSLSLNDAIVQGYNGLTGYLPIHSASLMRFNRFFSIGDTSSHSEMSWEMGNMGIANMLGVKYYLSLNELNSPNFVFYKKINNTFIYKNKNFIPFGTVFRKYIAERDFNTIGKSMRQGLINLNKFVVISPGDSNSKKSDFIDTISYPYRSKKLILYSVENILVTKKEKEKIFFNSLNRDPIFYFSLNNTHLTNFKLSFDLYSEYNGKGEIRWVEEGRVTLRSGKEIGVFDNNYVEKFSVIKGWNDYTFHIFSDRSMSGLRIDPINKLSEGMALKNINFSYHKSKKDSFTFNDYQSLNIKNFNDDLISGTIKVEEKGMLFFPILYDGNWKLYVDGVEKKLVRANIGFSGVMIGIGEHTIILKYIPKGLDFSIALSFIGLAMLIVFGVVNNKNNGSVK